MLDISVYDYFTIELKRKPKDETLKQLGINTPCGEDCVEAIDRAAELIAVFDKASLSLREEVVATTDHCVQIFWRG